MRTENLISITAETYAEEQFLLSKFPNSFWVLKEDDKFHTFFVKERNIEKVSKVLTEWSDLHVSNEHND